ncbi:MAG: hypothetical protein H3C50_12000 [Kiritimatiellae bacterium]|nr:hypothetical protein [Kiritimatiellia bacterium]MCO5069479.1 hypothetical protein [Kiritimatiellia bacterium]
MKTLHTLRVAALLSLASLYFNAFSEAGSPISPTTASGDETVRRLDQDGESFKALSRDALMERLGHASARAPHLSAFLEDMDPALWVSDFAGHQLFRGVLWPAAQIAGRDPGSPHLSKTAATMTGDAATSMITDVLAFREMSRRGDKSLWDFLLARSRAGASVFDLCVMTQIMWGESLDVLPPPRTASPTTPPASTLIPSAPNPQSWMLPAGTPDQWRLLFVGSNAVFRLLATKGLDLWASANELPSLLRTALNDPYLSIRDEAVSRLDRLAPEVQVQLLDEYAHQERARVPATEADREAAKWLNDRVAEKIKTLHVKSNPVALPEK